MHEEKEIKERILSQSEQLFLQFGYSKVTMDEIAASLGMSKKTLYKFFPGKEALVKEMITTMKCSIDDHIESVWTNEEMDFMDKLKSVMNFIGKQTTKLHGPLLEDLHKNIPEVWKEIHDFRKTNAVKRFTTFINEGTEKGVFRKDIDRQLIVLFYLHAIQGMINPETLSQLPYSANQVFDAIIRIIFEGILTEEGRKEYLSYDNEEIIKGENQI
ncbi:MAG TPA: TetR/AcrR family transcriptional regulator [Ignavibacteriaceae bacterium]|jgi:AcrR family transcriptional regulator|nr:TetR/AcrR family transcriptional regulator [Ignavibacteriaceae bacterium]